jgi:DNA-binding response OmpR family regulator
VPHSILVCDDHDLMRTTMVDLLVQHGYDVLQARSADEALAETASGRPDLVLMDLRLKGKSGLEAIQRIREQPDIAATPVILMSGEIDAYSSRWQSAGADGYLPKPFEVQELFDAVEALLR